jgi:hypothetical protein
MAQQQGCKNYRDKKARNKSKAKSVVVYSCINYRWANQALD